MKTFLPADSSLDKVGRDSISGAIVGGVLLGPQGYLAGAGGPWLKELVVYDLKTQNKRNSCK